MFTGEYFRKSQSICKICERFPTRTFPSIRHIGSHFLGSRAQWGRKVTKDLRTSCKAPFSTLSCVHALGGLGIPFPTKSAAFSFRSSTRISEPLAALILRQGQPYPESTIASQKTANAAVWTNNRTAAQEEAEALRPRLPRSQQFRMDQAREKEASCWLTTLPIQKSSANRCFEMLYVWGMGGSSRDSPHTVRVGRP